MGNELGMLINYKICLSLFLSLLLSGCISAGLRAVCPRPDGAWALRGAAGSGRGQTLPGAAHPAQELPREALLQLAAGPLVPLHRPGRAFSGASLCLEWQNPSSPCGIDCWSWARGVAVAGGGL